MTEPRDGAPEEALEPIDDADVDAIEDDLLDEAEVDEAEVDDYDAALREVAGDTDAAVPAAPIAGERRPSAKRRGTAPATTRAPSPSEIAVHVKEDVSKVFVIATVAVFTVILLNGLVLGSGGLLRPLATPTPSPTASPAASPSPSTSSSPSPSTSSSPSPSAS